MARAKCGGGGSNCRKASAVFIGTHPGQQVSAFSRAQPWYVRHGGPPGSKQKPTPLLVQLFRNGRAAPRSQWPRRSLLFRVTFHRWKGAARCAPGPACMRQSREVLPTFPRGRRSTTGRPPTWPSGTRIVDGHCTRPWPPGQYAAAQVNLGHDPAAKDVAIAIGVSGMGTA